MEEIERAGERRREREREKRKDWKRSSATVKRQGWQKAVKKSNASP